ncbi:MAG: hypothetical protein WEC12_08540 [Balneolaceae bacterium]
MTIQEITKNLQSSDRPVAKALHIGDHFKVLIFGFKKGMQLEDHQAYHPTKLFVISGRIIYKQGQDDTELMQYDEIEIPVKAFHSVEALEDSFVLLTQG